MHCGTTGPFKNVHIFDTAQNENKFPPTTLDVYFGIIYNTFKGLPVKF